MRNRVALLATVLLVGLAAAGRAERLPRAEACPPEGRDAAASVPSAATGTIRGVLRIDGKTEHRKLRLEESVVSLKGAELAEASKPRSAEPVVMDQNGIAYIPTVLAVVAGTTVEFRNSDPTLHNVHCACVRNRTFNVGVGPGQSSRVVFDRPEIVIVTCNIHAEMKAFIVVLENGFFTKPSKTGEFRIGGVPPGTWQLRGWHDGTAASTVSVTVRAGEESAVEVDLATKKRR